MITGTRNAHRARSPLWEQRFDDLKRLMAANGGLMPRAEKRYSDEYSLYEWCTRQRHGYRDGRLSDDRARKLREVGVLTTRRQFTWYDTLSAVATFRKKHRRLPCRRSSDKRERSLALWHQGTKRRLLKGGLSEDRARALRDAGLLDNNILASWHKTLRDVQTFHGGHGRYPDTNSRDRRERNLGKWYSYWHLKAMRGQVTDGARYEALVDAGLTRKRPYSCETVFDENLRKAKAFVGTHGRMPSRHADDPHERILGSWRSNQLHRLRIGKMSPPLRVKFVTAGFATSHQGQTRWDNSYQRLHTFIRNHARFPRAEGDPEERRMHQWFQTQRRRAMTGTLNSKRMDLLTKVDRFRVSPETKLLRDWENRVRTIEAFVEKNGWFPRRKSPDPAEARLGQWGDYVRGRWRRGKLTFAQKVMLERVGIAILPGGAPKPLPQHPERALAREKKDTPKPEPKPPVWDIRLTELKEWQARNPGQLPSSSARDPREQRLARWRIMQRFLARGGKLTEEKKRKLESVEMTQNRFLLRWDRLYEDYRRFIEEHGRNPSCGVSASEHEKKLANWRSYWTRPTNESRLDQRRRALWQQVLGERSAPSGARA